VHVGASYVEDAPEDRARVRLVASVSYSAASASPEAYWYEVPAGLAGNLARDGNAWLAALLPLAAALGEPLEWELPVDRPLLDGALEVLRIWRSWYGETAVVPLRGPVTESPTRPSPRRTCAFLSGGVDSFFTALDHANGDGREERGSIDEFLFVGGFDMRLDALDGIERVRRSVTEAAAALGRPLHFVRTNLREPEMRWNKSVDWGLWGNGPALASVPLALGPRYDRALIPASNLYASPSPWGSHPLTDSLLSSWTLRVRDDGAAYDRPDKVRAVASSDLVRRHLRVCFKSADGRNCGRCMKCLLTMMMLETAVGLSACPTFPARLDFGRVRALCIEKPWERRHLLRLRQHAVEAGRSDVVGTVNYLLGWRGLWRCRARRVIDRLFGRRAVLRRAMRRALQAAASVSASGNRERTPLSRDLRQRPPGQS
jgi:hypothetical protein